MATIVRGQVAVSANNTFVTPVTQTTGAQGTAGNPFALTRDGGTTGTASGGTGSYLESVIIMLKALTTVGSCAVFLSDSATGTVQIFGSTIAGTASTINAGTVVIPLGAISKFGPWRISFQNSINVTAIGRWV